MKPNELFNHIRKVPYIRVGKDLDFFIEVVKEEKLIRVCFEESRSKLDWLFNFLFMIFPTIIGWCPYYFSIGWWTSWKSGKELVLHSILDKIQLYPDYKVQICGFSFGGAISQICGIELYQLIGKKSELITFGSPKPLFGLWTKFMARRCFISYTQYAHWSDIITWCPPLPLYHTLKNTRLGKFSFKGLLDPYKYHRIYKEESLYE